jgi:putative hemolysin
MLIALSVLLALIALNGLFAMSEIAVISAKRPRLARLAEQGNGGAARALELSAEPTRFLSTVQIGITAVGILSGAIGEATVAPRLRLALEGASEPCLLG